MKVRRLIFENFRGAVKGTVQLGDGHTLLLGGNNVGKSTVCEALDLVLGPERLYRRPVVDEHDFFCGKYLAEDGTPVEIKISAVLVDLSAEARNRFFLHLRPWDDSKCDFAELADGKLPDKCVWALPVSFIGRYEKAEDDFVGNTFFDHPWEPAEEDPSGEAVELALGEGRKPFVREHKRVCGFVYLRAYRTGARALSMQKGSLLDTILRIGGGGLGELWEQTLASLRALNPGVGEIKQLKTIRDELEKRMSRFIKLGATDRTSYFASDLTREHLREVVTLFVAAHPDSHLLPFQRLGTGSLNLLVFTLLTFIADLKGKQSVIFAMEEPEIALPPHTQRRATRFALSEMGQVIATSHSPYVIEQFTPDRIVVLERSADGQLTGRPVLNSTQIPNGYRKQPRQFAEALLANAVLVVEGGTELALFKVAASLLEQVAPEGTYVHPDLDGISFFDAGGDKSVPSYGPVFQVLQKRAFAFHDTPKTPFTQLQKDQLVNFEHVWVSPKKKIEELLVDETPLAVQREFLMQVKDRDDYPDKAKTPTDQLSEDEVRALTKDVMLARKGEASGYAAILLSCCKVQTDIPATFRMILEDLHSRVSPPAATVAAAAVAPTQGPPLANVGSPEPAEASIGKEVKSEAGDEPAAG